VPSAVPTEIRPGAANTGIVYALTCPGGKRYIGKTTRSLSKRASEHTQPTSGCRLIREALKAIGGLDTFKTEILVCCSAESLDANESLYIERLDTLHPRGYNLRAGSRAGYESNNETTMVLFDEARAKLDTAEDKAAARAIVAFAAESDLCGDEPMEEDVEESWEKERERLIGDRAVLAGRLENAENAIRAIAKRRRSVIGPIIAGDFLTMIGERRDGGGLL